MNSVPLPEDQSNSPSRHFRRVIGRVTPAATCFALLDLSWLSQFTPVLLPLHQCTKYLDPLGHTILAIFVRFGPEVTLTVVYVSSNDHQKGNNSP